ncbi:MAG: hypothetical protein KBB46_01180 [Candidatus Pacebacteria bacterium]|nr:hypothetical protein [Candidatus Paceibacterota bacterium]
MGFLESISRRGLGETARKLRENVMWDVADGVATTRPPLKVEVPIPPNTSELPIVDYLFNPLGDSEDFQKRLWKKVQFLSPGTYVTRDYVGDTKEGTAHPHYFVIDRNDAGATLLFVDPEHYLNRSPRKGKLVREGDIRPQVCNLMAVRFQEGQTNPDVAMTRFRTGTLRDPAQVTFEAQLTEARNLFDNQGIPTELAGHEEEIILRLVVESSANRPMLLQSRYADKSKDLEKFMRKGQGTSFLRGKARSFWGLMGEFSAHLDRGEFKLQAEQQVAK